MHQPLCNQSRDMTQKGRGHACAPIVLLSYEDKRDQLVPLDKVWQRILWGF